MVLRLNLPDTVELGLEHGAGRVKVIVGLGTLTGGPDPNGLASYVTLSQPGTVSGRAGIRQLLAERSRCRRNLACVVLVRPVRLAIALEPPVFGHVPDGPSEIVQVRSASGDAIACAVGIDRKEARATLYVFCKRHETMKCEPLFEFNGPLLSAVELPPLLSRLPTPQRIGLARLR